MSQQNSSPDSRRVRRVVFQYFVPVHVEVEDGLVARVTVIDETPVRNPTAIAGDAAYLVEAAAAADDGQLGRPGSLGFKPSPLSPPSPARLRAGLSFRRSL
ncbi:hypothetical protein K9U39_17630 [Rhodoblastus acidophilus]|uniref:Uncharacterized protein n=1 Tax=Candidatus Rhodoblastus alkanivorans TaxID=2954117 RepID=A0ABS9Z253_9HYPH|nr:hypothetical protein [Candidatus Rhodoblastus alkanivorans]MCI4679058.1 hypothetical protein [Candidatus Rhodoblastus alkanivorans]MCI4681687.1 hypothetical protein [Candidatus Rhodoblastus alkanivorans]MDI4642735.1 hypothetical protein [Rhodoblastus acidophilus]